MAILERAADLEALHASLRETARGEGRLVLVSGEMGIGKTSLVEQFVQQVPPTVAIAAVPFDGLSIPAPLGPLFDLARLLGHDAGPMIAAQAPRASVFHAIESSLRGAERPVLIVAEDAHWADEASLEFIRFLGRRIGSLRAMAIVTYRDDELDPGHPLRPVIGDLATTRATRRIAVQPLSVDAVRTLATNSPLDPEALHATTGGNAFFVTEILASGQEHPVSIAEAVLGRAARLGTDARETLDTTAAFGQRVEPLILSGVVGRPIEREIDAALAAGLLRADGTAIAFRHAAVQGVIAGSLSPARAVAIHGRILAYLERHPGDGASTSHLAHHAEQAQNQAAAHRHALEAATEATRLQSHREAADQYARALRCAGEIAPATRADLLESHAYACFLTSRMDDAIVSQQEAAELWHSVDNQRRHGHNLRRLSRYWFFNGRHRIGLELAERSYEVLQAFPESSEFAMSCGYLAEWRIRAERLIEARELADRATGIADRLGDPETTVHVLITVGMVQLAMGDATGRATLDAGLAMAQEIGHEEFELRALAHLSEAYEAHRFRPESRPYAEAGLALARNRDFATMIALYGSVRLTMLLDACDWPAAIEESAILIGNGDTAGRLLMIAHLVWARARLRSGLAAAQDLDPAWRHANILDDPVARAMVMSARLEAAWLAGTRLDEGESAALLDAARAASEIRTASELALWLSRTGTLTAVPGWLVEPYASEIHGEFEAAAAMWEAAGVPLEALRARSGSSAEPDLRAAHAGFITLGAEPDALRVARRMQELGVRRIPRGPRPSTRQHPAGLSRREVEVLALLAEGTSNREIADRLSVSPKTIDHHVSSILGKLGAANRQQAVAKARAAGLLPI